MFNRFNLFLILCLTVCSISTFSQQSFAQTTSNESREKILNIGVSFAIPPWVISETDSGIELEILQKALAESGYQIKPNYLSFAMAYSLFEVDKLDGIINAKEEVLKKGFLSEPVVTFQNVAISLKDKNFPEDISISFLQDKSVVAFQKASLLLGSEFENMSKNNSSYQEVSKQSLQINLLMIRDIDFIIMDKSIFGYYWHEAQHDPNLLQAKTQLDRDVRFHYIFKPTPYRFAFQSKEVRDQFNLGLKKLIDNGEHDAILKKYSHLSKLYRQEESGLQHIHDPQHSH